jgi:hypothetical protein
MTIFHSSHLWTDQHSAVAFLVLMFSSAALLVFFPAGYPLAAYVATVSVSSAFLAWILLRRDLLLAVRSATK